MMGAVIIYIELLRKSMDWFLYDNGLCHERVKTNKVLRMMIQQHKSVVAVHLKFINKRISKFRLGCAGHISGIARLDKRFYS